MKGDVDGQQLHQGALGVVLVMIFGRLSQALFSKCKCSPSAPGASKQVVVSFSPALPAPITKAGRPAPNRGAGMLAGPLQWFSLLCIIHVHRVHPILLGVSDGQV